MEIKSLLKKLGLTDNEVKVYLTVVREGKIRPSKVSKITNINRTTVYSIAKELVKKNLIFEDLGGPNSYLISLPPEDLQTLIVKEETKLQETKELVNQAVAELSLLAKEIKYSIPKITFITQDKLSDFLYQETDKWNYSALGLDKTWWGFQDPTFVGNFEKWIDWSWQRESCKEIQVKLLSSKSEIESKMSSKDYERRLIKFWDKSTNFSVSTWVIGNYIIMINTQSDPFYLTEIHDQSMADNYREIFKAIWQTI